MKVYKCLISGDEVFTDSTKFEETNGLYKLKAKWVTRKADDVDGAALGANPSAEEADEQSEEATESGLDIVLAGRLVETGFDKKGYKDYLKLYSDKVIQIMKAKGLTEEEMTVLKSEMNAAAKFILGRFKELTFYTGASMNVEGMVAVVDWVDEEEDGKQVSTPYFYVMKSGIESCKY